MTATDPLLFALEATGSLDTADRLRTEMARDSENARHANEDRES